MKQARRYDVQNPALIKKKPIEALLSPSSSHKFNLNNKQSDEKKNKD